MASKFVHAAKTWICAHGTLFSIATVAFVTVAIYVGVFVAPKTIVFSYATTKSCTILPTALPALPRTVVEGRYTVSPQGGLKLGGVWLFATRICVAPTKAPQAGTVAVGYAPFGGWLFAQRLSVAVPDAPKASSKGLDAPIPTTKKLPIELSAADTIHTYMLVANQKTGACTASSAVARLECDVASLDLEQGKDYTFELRRMFKGLEPQRVLAATIHTLRATTIVDSSVKPGETVYARPTEFTFTTDKSLKKAKASLKSGTTSIPVDTTVNGNTITATLAQELEREKDYVFTITDLEASDGSTLVDPYEANFRMSGGPKVVGVSIGRAGVAQNASIVVTFDQALSGAQDIAPIASVNGVSARATKAGNTVTFSLQGAPLCTDFTLSLKKGLESSFSIAANTDWSYASRITCHTLETIGYSVKGRAIQAYTFGSGTSTVLYTGAIHGNELSASRILFDWIDYLEANARQLPAGRKIVVVPTVNPDGVAASSRNNAHNVNLNRNFATNDWKKDINDTNGTVAGGGGATPASEAETQVIAAFSSRLRPRLVLSYHAVGSVAIANQAGDSSSLAATYARLVGYSNGTGNSSEIFDYEITGTYDDWLAEKLGVPSIVVELGSYTYRDFNHHRQAFWTMATS